MAIVFLARVCERLANTCWKMSTFFQNSCIKLLSYQAKRLQHKAFKELR